MQDFRASTDSAILFSKTRARKALALSAAVNATLNTTLSTTLNTAEMTYNQTKLDMCPFSSKFSRCVEEMQVLTRLWQSTLSLDVVSVEASFAASEPRLTKQFADRANARNLY